MSVDQSRVEKYLGDIASELQDITSILRCPDEEILANRHLLKSLKYSVVVIAEAMGGLLQHILARRHKVAISGYVEAFTRAREYAIVPQNLIDRLVPFVRFRNIVVHQYWRVENQVFLRNVRDGIEDFGEFIGLITEQENAP